MTKRTYTIAEAAEVTGLSRKAIARRVERGSLQSLVRGGRRMIPHAELMRAGLLPEEGEVDDGDFLSSRFPARHPAPLDASGAGGDASTLAALMRELVDRLERQAGEIAHFRAITAEAESLRLSRELGELRARLSTLEGQRPLPALERETPAAGDALARAAADAAQMRRSTGDAIWLPPSAAATSASAPAPGPATPSGEPREDWPRRDSVVPRLLGLVAEALFILAVAAGAWFAGLRPLLVVAAIGAAWILVAAFEWLRWSDRNRHAWPT